MNLFRLRWLLLVRWLRMVGWSLPVVALFAAFAAALNKLYAASKAESRAGFPHFQQTAKGGRQR